MTAVFGVVVFVLVIIVTIMFHEFGHYITAKRFGMKVEEFFLGFGPRLWSTRRGETEYGVKAIPAGGYVRIAGMNPFQEVPPEEVPRTFGAKPAWQRAIVLVAGSFTHFVLAFLLLMPFFLFIGVDEPRPVVDEVVATLEGGDDPTPAADAGLRPGDRIVAVDGTPVDDWEAVSAFLFERPGERVELTLERDGAEIPVSVTLAAEDLNGDGTRDGFLGIRPSFERVREGPVGAAAESGSLIGTFTVESVKAFGRVFGPEGIGRLYKVLVGQEQRRPDDVVSVVGAARLSGDAAQAGQWDFLLILFAQINIFVGLLNLVPLPPLDGGHLAVLGFEKLSGRKVDVRKLIPLTAVVAAFLMLFMVTTVTVDILRPLSDLFE